MNKMRNFKSWFSNGSGRKITLYDSSYVRKVEKLATDVPMLVRMLASTMSTSICNIYMRIMINFEFHTAIAKCGCYIVSYEGTLHLFVSLAALAYLKMARRIKKYNGKSKKILVLGILKIMNLLCTLYGEMQTAAGGAKELRHNIEKIYLYMIMLIINQCPMVLRDYEYTRLCR